MDEVLPSDFLRVLRLSVKSSAQLVDALAEDERNGAAKRPNADHIRRIIARILWHRKFVLTYYIVLLALVVVLCGYRVYKTINRRYHKAHTANEKAQCTTTPSSSSSSTLFGIGTPPRKDDTESTPLLGQEACSPKTRPMLHGRLKASLMYQPRAIRALTTRINVLPDNGTTLATILFLALNAFYLLYRTTLSMEWIFILGDRAGLLFVVNLPVLYILAAKTNQPIKFLTGWSYEGLNLFHRRLGEWMIVLSVVHMLGMTCVWYTILRPTGFTFLRYITAPTVLLGLVTILSYLIIYVTSVGWFRQLYYEAFLGLHIVFQVLALAFLFFHYPTAKPYVIATFCIWAVDRLVWRITISSRKFLATLTVAPDQDTVMVHCDIPLQRSILGVKLGLHHGWRPGQHLFLTIPSMGFKHRFQAHPFTIASPAPPSDATIESWPLQLVIRSIDGFSLDLRNYARYHQHCEVILDGPHGGVEALEAASHADRTCFIAGGSGIAVTYPLAWDHQIEEHKQAKALLDTRTVYKNGRKHVPDMHEVSSVGDTSRYSHFWVRQDPRHASWITLVPKTDAVRSKNDLVINRSGDVKDGVEHVTSLVTHTFDTRRAGPEGGRPDMKSEIWNWVTSPSVSSSSSVTSVQSKSISFPDLRQRQREHICLVVSGPDGLVRDVRNIASRLVKEGWHVEVWVEKFGW